MPKSLTYEFKEHKAADARSRSAVCLIKLLLQKNLEISLEHRSEFLGIALWKITEAESTHKHRTRFCSESAYAAPGKDLRHDHVFQRAVMVKDLIESKPEDVDEILKKAVACTITKAEHGLLNQHNKVDGWERYRRAGISVIDMKTR